MAETSLSSLVKDIEEAMRFDNDNFDKEAYKKYVSCIYKIATNLILTMKVARGDVIISSKTSRQVKLVQQCADRVTALVERMEISKSKPAHSSTSDSYSPAVTPTSNKDFVDGLCKKPARSESTTSTDSQLSQDSPSIQWNSQAERFTAAVPSLPLENNPHIYNASKRRALSPMEIAKKQNQSLLAAYKARMNRLNRSDFSAFNYSLTIQRKMAENIAIAQAQEEELAKKMQARNKRLEEEAARRFATPIGMSEEEQEQRQTYKKILEYENEAKWLQKWRKKLESNPKDPVLISQLVQEILRCSDHPLTELLRKYQFKIYERLYPLVANKHAELDQIKVPLPQEAWPSPEEIAEAAGDKGGGSSPTSPVEKAQRSDKTLGKSVEKKKEQDSVKEDDNGIDEPDESCNDMSQQELDNNNTKDVTDLCQGKSDSNKGDTETDESISSDTPVNEDDGDSWDDPLCVKSDSQHSLQNITHKDKSLINESSQLANVAAQTKEDLEISMEKGKQLETQMSYERKQAQLLMRQVTRDYDKYNLENADLNDDNLDYLFDDDGDEDDEYNCYSSLQYFTPSKEAIDLSHNVAPSTARPSSPSEKSSLTSPASQETATAFQNVVLDRSTSYQPSVQRHPSEEFTESFRSLPIPCDETDGIDKKKLEELSQEAYQRHLKSIAEDCHRFLEKLLVMLTIAYEPLDTPEGKDQCAVSLEEAFFKPIWKTLLRLFRAVNYKQELLLAYVMTRYSNATPEDLKVSKKLCLIDSTLTEPPYHKAIIELRRVQDYYTMLNKLECVVKVCRLICECVDDHYKKKEEQSDSSGKKAPSIGADDLLPILNYVVIQSALPQLGSECQAMSEFIHEGYMMGEEGYCLTTLRTSLNYVTTLLLSSVKS